jgi:hypothetical protein
MPLARLEGRLLSNDVLLRDLIENEPNRMQMAFLLPFVPIRGDQRRVERSATTVDYGTNVLDDGLPGDDDPRFDTGDTSTFTTKEGVAIPTQEANFELKLLVHDVVVQDYVSINQSAKISQAGVQLGGAARRLLYVFWTKFTTGDQTATPEEFNGLQKLVTAGQSILPVDTTNYYLELEDLSRLIAKVTANNGRPHALYTSDLGYRNILAAHYARGIAPDYTMLHVPDGHGGHKQLQLPTFEDVPILKDDFCPSTEALGPFNDGISVYAMTLGSEGVYAITAADAGPRMMTVREVLDETSPNAIYRLTWPVGLCLDKEDALARLQFRPQSFTL